MYMPGLVRPATRVSRTATDPARYAANVRWVVPVIVCLGLCGCGSYQFALTRPADASGPVAGQSFTVDPLRYSAAVDDDRLAIRVDNQTADTVQLVGPASSVVDPAGRSHPLIGQTIAAASHVVVVLPPLRPWFGATADVGPTSAVPPPPGGLTPVEQQASADPGYDRASPVYWDWPGPGTVRVRLVYRRTDGSTFAHDLTFERRRA